MHFACVRVERSNNGELLTANETDKVVFVEVFRVHVIRHARTTDVELSTVLARVFQIGRLAV